MTEHDEFLTVEQAVARLINLDYIPEGFALLDMTASFLEDAQGAYESSQEEGMDADALELIACWANSCEARHALAESLMESLQKGIERSESDLKLTTDKSTGQTLVSLGSLNEWAAFRFGIQVPDIGDHSTTPVEVAWDKIKIKIYADYKIGFWVGEGEYKKSSFQNIGLMGKRKNDSNKLGGILIGLSKGKRFPKGKTPNGADKAAICKLRGALKKLAGLSKDPFTPFNEADGWKPRFTLIDDGRNADKRAKERSVHVQFDEQMDYELPDFDNEDDEAGKFINSRPNTAK
ncbi:MAG: hypothetical protein Q7U82_00765 [Gammaproteobacteria bacterium]|nr:hypothetical protein [Gammaproteobacteria bacterium]